MHLQNVCHILTHNYNVCVGGFGWHSDLVDNRGELSLFQTGRGL